MHLSNRSNVPEDAAGIRGWRLTCFVAVAMLAAAGVIGLEVWADPPGWLRGPRGIVVGALHWVRVHWPTSGAIAAGAAVAAVVVSLYQARRKAAGARAAAAQRIEAERASRAALLAAHCWVDEHTGDLPRVGKVDPVALGVHPAADLGTQQAGEGRLDLPDRVPVYVPRDRDAEVDAALARGGLVVLVGDSTAGKSRAAYEAVRRLPGDRRLLVPHRRESLRVLLDSGVQLREVIVWLDDLERFLGGQAGLDGGLLQRVVGDSARRVVVVATMRASEYAHSADPGREESPTERELRKAERAVLELATRVELARRFSPAELERAEQQAHDPRIVDALAHAGHYGLAEYVAAGPVLWRRWRDGLAVDNPPERLAGAAITAVAVDCRRAGFTDAVPATLLAELFLDYLDQPVARRVGPGMFEAGLAWAARPVQATSALLLPAEDGWIAFDYLVDQLQGESTAPPVPDRTWTAVVSVVATDSASGVATAAYFAGRPDIAEQANRKAADAGDHIAQSNLGLLLNRRGLVAEAERWWRKAADAGYHEAQSNLGVLLKERGDLAEAEQWFRKAADAGHHLGEFNLGVLLGERGDLAEAEQWYRKAADAGHHTAEFNLGGLLNEQGLVAEAEQWWRKAADAGHHDAQNNLGVLLKERGDLAEAEQWYRKAADAGHHTAEYNLGVLLYEQDRATEAGQWFRKAADAGLEEGTSALAELRDSRSSGGQSE